MKYLYANFIIIHFSFEVKGSEMEHDREMGLPCSGSLPQKQPEARPAPGAPLGLQQPPPRTTDSTRVCLRLTLGRRDRRTGFLWADWEGHLWRCPCSSPGCLGRHTAPRCGSNTGRLTTLSGHVRVPKRNHCNKAVMSFWILTSSVQQEGNTPSVWQVLTSPA